MCSNVFLFKGVLFFSYILSKFDFVYFRCWLLVIIGSGGVFLSFVFFVGDLVEFLISRG